MATRAEQFLNARVPTFANTKIPNVPYYSLVNSTSTEPPPALLWNFAANDFITYWMNKGPLQAGAPGRATAFLANVNNLNNFNSPNVNSCMILLSEGDVVRSFQQYVLNGVEVIAQELVRNIDANMVITSRSEWDIVDGRVDMQFGAHTGNVVDERPILYLEFKYPKSLRDTDWNPMNFTPPMQTDYSGHNMGWRQYTIPGPLNGLLPNLPVVLTGDPR